MKELLEKGNETPARLFAALPSISRRRPLIIHLHDTLLAVEDTCRSLYNLDVSLPKVKISRTADPKDYRNTH